MPVSDDGEATNAQSPDLARRQFSLGSAFLYVLFVAVAFAVLSRYPSESLIGVVKSAPVLVVSVAILVYVPLAAVAMITSLCARVFAETRNRSDSTQSGSSRSLWRGVLAPYRSLMQCGRGEALSLGTTIVLATSSTLVLAVLWYVIREVGLSASLMIDVSTTRGWDNLKQFPPYLVDGEYFWRLGKWELWAIARWWLLFGVLTSLWSLVAWPWRRRLGHDSAYETLRRFLAFAPWLIVLELAFLVGVWTLIPNVVPEPSTLFVSGVFSWDLWRWDCWLERSWLARGTLPTLLVGTVFFRFVPRWHWPFAAIGGACLIPAALTLSVAWSVAYVEFFLKHS